ncbi:2TM domain-containing protein [Prochlorococcus marinus]|uniref:2TM domain-containing protein n=1 Tax=Prochlorococcus marinus TaxID=1219 RepID=UPI0022B36FDC|nr:2TM domain-containing protein [Prochlorococcus marinus]
MPLRWYGNGDPTDPLYLHFSRIVNFTIHAMAFAAVNSGLWLAHQIRHNLPQLQWITGLWLLFLIFHLTFVIIRRPSAQSDSSLKSE